MLFYLVFCCDLLVTVSLFESHLKVPKQDGSVLWKTTSGWAFYIEMDMAWKRPWPVLLLASAVLLESEPPP
jgi:hypothetical protein